MLPISIKTVVKLYIFYEFFPFDAFCYYSFGTDNFSTDPLWWLRRTTWYCWHLKGNHLSFPVLDFVEFVKLDEFISNLQVHIMYV